MHNYFPYMSVSDIIASNQIFCKGFDYFFYIVYVTKSTCIEMSDIKYVCLQITKSTYKPNIQWEYKSFIQYRLINIPTKLRLTIYRSYPYHTFWSYRRYFHVLTRSQENEKNEKKFTELNVWFSLCRRRKWLYSFICKNWKYWRLTIKHTNSLSSPNTLIIANGFRQKYFH